MTTKKALTWIGVAFVFFFIVSSPEDAGGVVHSAFSGIETTWNALAAFVMSIVR